MVHYSPVDRTFAALADPTRRVVLERLGQGSATITADWHWSRSEWFPGGNDAVVIRWSGPDESGAESFTLADVPPIEMGTGMWHGSADPSAARAAALEVESPSVVIGIDLAQQRYADGHVVVTLLRDPDSAAHGQLVAGFTYVHLDAWQQPSGDAPCEW